MLRPLPLTLCAATAGLMACSESPGVISPPEPPGPPATLEIVSGNEQRGIEGQALAQPIVMQVLDSADRPVPDQPVSFLVVAGGGSLSADTVRSDASGRAEVRWTLGEPGVPQTLHVRVPINPEATSFLFDIVSAVASSAATNLRFESVYAGALHSCGLTAEGAAYCWGLLSNDGTSRWTPTPVPGGLTFIRLATGAWALHTCGLTRAGAGYCWGDNRAGQFGNGNTASSRDPVLVSGGLVFQEIAAGFDHSCALTRDGAAYCWGSNDPPGPAAGQLGDGTRTDRLVPTPVSGRLRFTTLAVGSYFSCGLDAEGAAHCWGRVGNRLNSSLEPKRVGGGLSFTAISAGSGHACGLIVGGAAYCWGDNFNDELGAETTAEASEVPLAVTGGFRFAAIAAGGYHTCALTLEGALACWGWDDQTIPSAPFNNGVSIHSATPVLVPGGHTFTSISNGLFHGCGVTADQRAYCWFDNVDGELGTGDQISSYEPVAVR